MKKLVLIIPIAVLALCSFGGNPYPAKQVQYDGSLDAIGVAPVNGGSPFGLYTSWSQGRNVSPEVKINAAKALRVTYIRIPSVSLAKDYPYTVRAGFKVILGTTRATLAQDLKLYPSELVTFENEENNPTQYFGSVEQYSEDLAQAVNKVHAARMKVTNGGITQIPAFMCAWANLYPKDPAAADRFAKAFATTCPKVNIIRQLQYPAILKNQEYLKGATLIATYKRLPLDYVNFHYYAYSPAGAPAMGVIIDYLRSATGKDVITNEFGQRDNDPETVKALMQVVKDKKLKCAIWFNSDSFNRYAHGLMDINGSLRKNGNAFGDFVKKNF